MNTALHQFANQYATTDRILTVEDLRVTIPVPGGTLRPVQGVSFHVDRGETLCIVGESGCGKSLTALAIMDLLPRRATRSAARLDLQGKGSQVCRKGRCQTFAATSWR
jgi:ABC-type glutathione transport system ATPase component